MLNLLALLLDGSTGAVDCDSPFSLLLDEITGVLSASSSSDSEAANALNALGTEELKISKS